MISDSTKAIRFKIGKKPNGQQNDRDYSHEAYHIYRDTAVDKK